MSTGAAQVNFQVTNLTQTVSTPIQGISFIQGRSVRGPIYSPDEVFNSWPRFSEKYGGLRGDLEAPTIIKRLLEKGGSIRFSRVGTGLDVAVPSSAFVFEDDGDEVNIFTIIPKYAGEDYNNLVVTTTAATNGLANAFNLSVVHLLEPTLSELYENIIIEGKPTVEESNYLRDVIADSKFVTVTYHDLSAVESATVRPDDMEVTFDDGSDGDPVAVADFTGASDTRTGFFAFDPYDDSYQITSLDKPVDAVDAIEVAGASYCSNRGDMINFPFLVGKTKSSLLSQRENLGDNKYQYIYGGWGKVSNPNGGTMEINPIGDIFALISASDRNYGEWFSFAGPNRGIITNMLGVDPNFGSNASFADLNDLANRQINMVIMRNNTPTLWGNFTGQLKDDQEKFISILRLIMFLKKSLRPTLEYFLEEPNDIPTWKRMFYTVKPFLDSLVTRRALYSYQWQGDQDAANIQSLQINNPTDVSKGKYKVNLVIKAIPSLQEINVNIILTPAGLEFEIVSELT